MNSNGLLTLKEKYAMKTDMGHDAFFPRKMQLIEKNREFCIEWKDGHESRFLLALLRENCPCAVCREERKNPFKLAKQNLERAIEPQSIEPQGHYAVCISWGDGHSTGIYTYEYLRKLCPCSKCRGHAV